MSSTENDPLPRFLQQKKPEVIIYIHSGGADPQTGEANEATLYRAMMGASLYHMVKAAGIFQPIIVAGGDETRKSGMVDQSAALTRVLIEMGVDKDNIATYPHDTLGCLQWMKAYISSTVMLYYVNDDVHMERYLEGVRLVSPALWKKTIPFPVPTGATGYGGRYSADYVLCYNALGWAKLAQGYLKARRLRTIPVGLKTLGMLIRATHRVGLAQFWLFAEDRWMNKATSNPGQLLRIAHIRQYLRPDLLGEKP